MSEAGAMKGKSLGQNVPSLTTAESLAEHQVLKMST
jgi:hypothetical protein